MNTSSSLYHHGVKGMKWGVRRSLEELGYDIKRGSRLPNKEGATILKKGTKFQRIAINSNMDFTTGVYTSYKIADMSNEEIERRIQRMNLEKRYMELSDSELNSGIKTAKQVLSTVGSIITVAASGVALAKTIKGLGGN